MRARARRSAQRSSRCSTAISCSRCSTRTRATAVCAATACAGSCSSRSGAGMNELAAVADGPAARLTAPELSPETVLGRIGGENFPVALRWLPRAVRRDLVAIYGAARLIDEAGDAARGDRRAVLDELEQDVLAAFAGQARHPLLRRLTPLAAAHGLAPDPFLRLIAANRLDQDAPDLASWDALQDYCRLSAQPVGELVLRVFDQASDANLLDSAAVCTALQVLEHCQDVAEDARVGRCYLPADDRARFGCGPWDLMAVPAPESLRRTVALQVERARALLAHGDALCARLRGFARPVVAGYAAGGWA